MNHLFGTGIGLKPLVLFIEYKFPLAKRFTADFLVASSLTKNYNFDIGNTINNLTDEFVDNLNNAYEKVG